MNVLGIKYITLKYLVASISLNLHCDKFVLDNSIDHKKTLKNTFREISNPKPRVIQEMPNKAVGYFTSFPIEP